MPEILQWFGHTTMRPGSFAHGVMRVLMIGSMGGGTNAKQNWIIGIVEWTGIGNTASEKSKIVTTEKI